MSADPDLLRRAAALMRGGERGHFYHAVADWLDATAEAHDGRTWSEGSPALAVARAYLGETP